MYTWVDGLFAIVGAAVLIGYPSWRIAKRMGFGPEMRPMIVAACVIFPVLTLWIIAFKPWPALGEQEG